MTTATAATIRVREARTEDVPILHALIGELAEYERLEAQFVAERGQLSRHLFGERPVAEALIAEVDGAAAGFALYFHTFSTFLGLPGLYLEDLYVRESTRGRGVGRALLSRVARIAVERGCGRLEWSVLDWNEPAIRFYRRIGAAPMDDWTIYRLTGAALEELADGAG
ncbi:MAG TPA: GNAT family N-acetyltransferase [Gammaproteobacteria bacterium]|nr:GNAT family N-acetyltransferase [Gammaproteobacteria bacterium]